MYTSPSIGAIPLVALLSTSAMAGPLYAGASVHESRSPLPQADYTTACQAADNCETYIDPITGFTNVRFVTGMEPGSDDYNSRVTSAKVKRDDGYPKTQITVGDKTVYWGCDTDPVAVLDHVKDICYTSGQCVTDDSYSEDVKYADPTQIVTAPDVPLSVTAVGTYPDDMRDHLVEGLKTAMSAEGLITREDVTYISKIRPANLNGQVMEKGTCSVAKAPTFIGLGVYSAKDTLSALISATVAVKEPDTGFCGGDAGQATALGASIAGAFGPVGAGLAAVFGTISAMCEGA